MRITELINKLSELRNSFGEHECVMGINRSSGYEDKGEIETYPIECVFMNNINESFYEGNYKAYANGYWEDTDDLNKFFLYVYP